MQSQTITMDSLNPIIMPHVEPSQSEMARRLELFEITQLEDNVEALQSELKQQSATHSHEVQTLQTNYQEKLQQQRDKFTLAVEAVEVNGTNEEARIAELELFVDELTAAGNVIGEAKDALQVQFDEQSATVSRLTQQLSKAQDLAAEISTELKALKALDPERLKKQVKTLQTKSTDQKTAIDALRKSARKLKADNETKSKTIIQLDGALDKACNDINEQNTPEPLETINLGTLGKWSVFGNPKMNRYDILDVANNVSFGVEVVDGDVILPEIRKVPKNLLKRIADRTDRYHQTEAAIATASQPLQTELSKEA